MTLPIGAKGHEAFSEDSPLAIYAASIGAESLFICQRVTNGPPQKPAQMQRCVRCHWRVWHSVRRRDKLPDLCYECKEDLLAQASLPEGHEDDHSES